MDKKKKILIIVDPQNDFIEGGSLGVIGAKRAMETLVSHLRSEGPGYDKIIVSLDTHHPTNLGFSQNWEGTRISEVFPCQPFPRDLIVSGGIYPKIPYTSSQDTKDVLSQPGFMCWPPHCIKGTHGHKVYGPLQEVLEGFSSKVTYLTKGESDTRDCYSIFHYGDRGLTDAGRDFKLWDPSLDDPEIYVAGLATDYCVFETIKSLQEITKGGAYYLLSTMCAAIQDCDVEPLYESLQGEVIFV